MRLGCANLHLHVNSGTQENVGKERINIRTFSIKIDNDGLRVCPGLCDQKNKEKKKIIVRLG